MSRTVLIVEDSENCRDLLEIALGKIPGVIVRSVPTAGEALQCIASDNVAVMIVDLHLPTMNGFELIRRIRAEPAYSLLPVVVISGDTDPDTPGRLHTLGAHAYFVKPYSPAEVRTKVEQLIHDF